jgi:hypothetical protein
MLQRVDAESVAVGQRDPVAIAVGEGAQHRVAVREPVVEIEVAEILEIAALVLGIRIVDRAFAEASGACARVPVRILELARPDAILGAGDACRRFAARVAPEAGRIPPGRAVLRLVRVARRAFRVEPVRARMIEDDVEEDAHAAPVRLGDERDEIAARADTRIDLEKILDAVAVEGVEVAALLEDGAQPDRRDAEIPQIAELRAHAGKRPALPPVFSRAGPALPAPRGAVDVRTRSRQIRAVEQRTAGLLPVAESVNEEKVEHLIAPIDRRGMVRPASRQDEAADRSGPVPAQCVLDEAHGVAPRSGQRRRI